VRLYKSNSAVRVEQEPSVRSVPLERHTNNNTQPFTSENPKRFRFFSASQHGAMGFLKKKRTVFRLFGRRARANVPVPFASTPPFTIFIARLSVEFAFSSPFTLFKIIGSYC
jgi:hypothetical protein